MVPISPDLLFGNGIDPSTPCSSLQTGGVSSRPAYVWWDAAHNEYLELLVDGGYSASPRSSSSSFCLVDRDTCVPRGGRGKSEIDESGLLILTPDCDSALLADGFFSTNLRTSYIRVLFSCPCLVPVVTTAPPAVFGPRIFHLTSG
jgi:hypothetical protein